MLSEWMKPSEDEAGSLGGVERGLLVGARFADEGQSPAVPKPKTFGRRQG